MKTFIKKAAALASVGLGSLLLTGQVFAVAPWSLFGSASSVKMGAGPNPWAVQLVSDVSDADASNDYGGVDFQLPQGNLMFSDLTELSTDYNITDDDCGGGSPRFQLNMDTDNDGIADGNIFVYIGPFPNYIGCPSGWQSSGNLITTLESRYDTTQLGGAFYDTYANALANYGQDQVLGIQLVADSGWLFPDGEQTVFVDNVMVNQHKLVAKNAR